MKKITLADIAAQFNVSRVAVHKALTDKKGVSDALRKRIKAYAKSVGYEAKMVKKNVTDKRFVFFVRRDFFLVPSEQFYSTIFYYLGAECNDDRNSLQVAFIEDRAERKDIEKQIKTYEPDGIFFAGQIDDEILTYLTDIDLPSVLIDFYSPNHPLNYVAIDHFYTSYRLTSYLIRKGHQAIGFIGNIDRSSSIADRYYGYIKALRENSIVPTPKWHINQTVERKKTTMHLHKDELPTAFICHCDAAAQWLYASLLTENVRIPDDVSVVSFDNTSLCESLYPKLTSIGPKKDEFGKMAYDMMIEAIESPDMKKRRLLIEPKLNVRDSVAKHAKE